jgi:hypothetical protein
LGEQQEVGTAVDGQRRSVVLCAYVDCIAAVRWIRAEYTHTKEPGGGLHE